MALNTSKVVHFVDSDDVDSAEPSSNRNGNNRQETGFGFTHHAKPKLLQTSQKLNKTRIKLPIHRVERELQQLIANNDTVVIVGGTGCGKSTQIPQFLFGWGYQHKCIAVTQPRRVAAISIAQRVSQEMGCNVGDTVGYHVRFDNTVSADTKIKYVTDGMLLRECVLDSMLKKYSIIILDEAHERTLNTDVLFGLIKRIQRTRNSDKANTRNRLKIIIMSATLQHEKFAAYFNHASVYHVTGAAFNVVPLYVAKPESNYLDATLTAVLQIHLDSPGTGDILAFLTGKDEIDSMRQMLKSKCSMIDAAAKHNGDNNAPTKNVLRMEILPLYGSLPPHAQQLVFKRAHAGFRKVILSTNLAETSITIPDIKFVIDSGKVKRRIFNPLTGIDVFEVQDISKEEAWQRCGRAGRTSDGMCFRLYTESHFADRMAAHVVPDILRSNLCSVILQLKSIGIDDILAFDLMDKPDDARIVDGIGKLMILGALDIQTQALTGDGRKMCIFPLDPCFSKIILSAHKYDQRILNDVLIVIAMLSVDGVYQGGGHGDRQKQNASYLQFEHEYGDHLTLLNVFNCYAAHMDNKHWCKQNFLNQKSLSKARQIYQQLVDLYEMHFEAIDKQEAAAAAAGNDREDVDGEQLRNEQICQCLLEGLFMNIAYYDDNVKRYKTYCNNNEVDIHPSSLLFQKKPKCILYSAMVKTNNTVWVKCCTQIANEEWLDNIIPNVQILNKIAIKETANAKQERKQDGEHADGGDGGGAHADVGGNGQAMNAIPSKPGKAVKRMHSMFETVKNGTFDFKSHRKNIQQKQNIRGQYSPMQQMTMRVPSMNSYGQHGHHHNHYNRNKNRNRNNNRTNHYNRKNGGGRGGYRFRY